MKIYRTTSLQIDSLTRFAKVLGYIPRDYDNLGQGFRIIDFRSWHTHYISLDHMVALHNNKGSQSHLFLIPQWVQDLDLPEGQLDKAQKGKLVEQVKLQRDKKSPLGVKVQNHFVREL